MRRQNHARVLMYSHDTFGLGHLRRSREIAHALVEQFKELQVLIVSGSSIAGAFDFRPRVDFVKIPSVIKLCNGEYTSLSDHVDLSETLEMRRAIIQQTAQIYNPNIFIVDKEPLGLRGELEQTLLMLKARGTKLVLGLREVLDAPEYVCAEWERTRAMRVVEDIYDALWVYGCKKFWDPLKGLDVPMEVRDRTTFTGHLRRNAPSFSSARMRDLPNEFILVTAGGGGDGGQLMRQVIAAREYDPKSKYPLVMILGPFMAPDERVEIRDRVRYVPSVSVLDFDSQIEGLMLGSTAIVSMGGYNTFCEIISFDKRALLVPRNKPRREQLIRASRAAELGIVDMLDPTVASDPRIMAEALRRLPDRQVPSANGAKIDLNGLEVIGQSVAKHIAKVDRPVPALAYM